MSQTYTLGTTVDPYDFSGEFYFVGDNHDTVSAVLKHVATDHILAMKERPHVGEYLLETLSDGENVSESTYNQADPLVSCGLHFDTDHQQFRFWGETRESKLGDGRQRVTFVRLLRIYRCSEFSLFLMVLSFAR